MVVALASFASVGARAASADDCTVSRVAEWKVRLVGNRVLIDGAINGQPAAFMLDTGAARTMVPRSATDRYGLMREEARGYRLRGFGGDTQAQAVRIDELRIGNGTRKGLRLLVGGELEFGPEIALVLGTDFLGQADVEFDLAHGAVRLFEVKGCANRSLAYWDPQAVQVPLARFGEAPALDVEVDDQPVRAMLDSGAPRSMVAGSVAERAGVRPGSGDVIAGGCWRGIGQRTGDSWIGTFRRFRVGDESIDNPRLTFSDYRAASSYASGTRVSHPADMPDMFLGMDFLRAHRVLVSNSQQRLYLTYAGGVVFPGLPGRPCTSEAGTDAPRR